jgi:hypothetical protein
MDSARTLGGAKVNNASIGLFNATLFSIPLWGIIYFVIRLIFD